MIDRFSPFMLLRLSSPHQPTNETESRLFLAPKKTDYEETINYPIFPESCGAVLKLRLYTDPPISFFLPPPSLQTLTFGGSEITDDSHESFQELEIAEEATLTIRWTEARDPNP